MNASNSIHFSRFFFVLPLALTLSACDLEDKGDGLLAASSETGASTNTEGASSNTDEPVENTTNEPGSSELDEALEVIVAESDVSYATGACPILWKCGASGSWSSTYATCKANCTSNCTHQEFNNGHCIPR